jgi:hypothetical protein
MLHFLSGQYLLSKVLSIPYNSQVRQDSPVAYSLRLTADNGPTFRTPCQHRRGASCLIYTTETCLEILLAKELVEVVGLQPPLGRAAGTQSVKARVCEGSAYSSIHHFM